jgi:hypothetical protein
METYHVVPHWHEQYGESFSVERLAPGEKPVLLPFDGSRSEAQAEADRLNVLAQKAIVPLTQHPPRPGEAKQLAKRVVDLGTDAVSEKRPAPIKRAKSRKPVSRGARA